MSPAVSALSTGKPQLPPRPSIWHAGNPFLRVGSRRWFLQAGWNALAAGCAASGVASLECISQSVATAQDLANVSSGTKARKAVILLWLSGGPSHIDMWDPKPGASAEIRGPYRAISTRLPGVAFCEHLPLQAGIADKLTVIRSVDCSASNHTPITMQAGNPLARRTDDGRDGGGYPSMGSVAARYRGANQLGMPAFVGLADSWKSDIWEAGDMGREFAPLKGQELTGKFDPPPGIDVAHLRDRHRLRQELDQLARRVDASAAFASTEHATQQAYEMVAGGKVRDAFAIDQETAATRAAYGSTSLGEKTLLARRLVEAGVTFVVVSGAWGYFDHHGDSVVWKGIEKGLTPLLPRVDQVLHALVTDLEQRGLLDDTLVMMMGEFGRAPVINADAGRDHWTNVMSMVLAGGGLNHGRVIGATDAKGGEILNDPVKPQDLAATLFRHLQIPLDTSWIHPSGRPIPIVVENGRPLT